MNRRERRKLRSNLRAAAHQARQEEARLASIKKAMAQDEKNDVQEKKTRGKTAKKRTRGKITDEAPSGKKRTRGKKLTGRPAEEERPVDEGPVDERHVDERPPEQPALTKDTSTKDTSTRGKPPGKKGKEKKAPRTKTVFRTMQEMVRYRCEHAERTEDDEMWERACAGYRPRYDDRLKYLRLAYPGHTPPFLGQGERGRGLPGCLSPLRPASFSSVSFFRNSAGAQRAYI